MSEYPNPRPWWAGIAEKLFTAALVLSVGVPTKLATGNDYVAVGAGIVAAAVVNIAYWRLIRGVALHEVYDSLTPWVDSAANDEQPDGDA